MARKGLGKGLSALLGNSDLEYEQAYSAQKRSDFVKIDEPSEFPSTELPISKIDPNINQPRKHFDENALAELTNSIRVHGVIQPIIVVKNNDRYMIIAGERRWRASKKAGLSKIPAIIKDYSPQQVKEVSLIENLQREDLNPVEAAFAIRQLMDEYHFTQEAVADRIGKSRPAIANTLRLLSLYPEVIDMISAGRLSAGHARCLVVVTNREAQLSLAKTACDNNLSVREFEKMVKEYLNPKPKKIAQDQSIELKELIDNMQRIFATKVSALGNDKRGRIYIDYYNKDDLDRLVELLDRFKALDYVKDQD